MWYFQIIIDNEKSGECSDMKNEESITSSHVLSDPPSQFWRGTVVYVPLPDFFGVFLKLVVLWVQPSYCGQHPFPVNS